MCVHVYVCECTYVYLYMCIYAHMWGGLCRLWSIALEAIQHFVFLDSNVIEIWSSRILLDWVVKETQKSFCLCLRIPKNRRAYRNRLGLHVGAEDQA